MRASVTYQVEADTVALVTMDDGKVNALSRAMFGEITAAVDRAEAAGLAVVLTGRPGILSGGFDLRTLKGDDVAETAAMVRDGFELVMRLLAFPRPLVVASPGHAVAMGLFLTLCGDARLGSSGAFRYVANEVAIGLSLPPLILAILRHRLTPSDFERAALTAASFGPQAAVAAGILTDVVEADQLVSVAVATARSMVNALDAATFAETKVAVRAGLLKEIQDGLRPLG